MVRGINFCKTDELDQAEQNSLEDFSRSFEFATKIHDYRIRLLREGHPEYQESSEKLIDETRKFSPEFLQKKFDTTAQLSNEWKKRKSDAFFKVPRLLLLRNSQLLTFLIQLQRAIVDGEAPFSWEYLSSVMQYMFPRATDENLRTLTLGSLQQRRLFELTKEQLSSQILEIAGSLLTDVGDKVADKTLRVRGECTKTPPTLFIASALTPLQLEASIIETLFDNEVPFDFQVFSVSPDGTTALEDLISFFERALNFPSYKYVIIGVNHLSSACKEEIIRLALDDTRLPSELVLVFTKDTSREMFTFLKQQSFDVLDVAQCRQVLDGAFDDVLPSFGTYESVVGRACDGKSTYIAEQIRKLNSGDAVKLICSITEDFKPRDVIKKLNRLPMTTSVVAIHFNISLLGPLHVLHRMTRSFLYSKFLVDEDSGEIFYLRDSIKWHFFFEIPSSSENFEGEIGDISANLPLISNLGAAKKVGPGDPMVINDTTRTVCWFLRAHFAHGLANAPLSKIPSRPTDAECDIALQQLWGAIPDIGDLKFDRTCYLRHLEERCIMMQHMHRKALESKASGEQLQYYTDLDPDFFPKLFTHFLKEVTFFCRGKLEGDWAKYDQGFICLSENGYDANLLHLSATKEQAIRSTALKISILDRDTATRKPQRLRVDLAPALGIKSDQLVNALERGTGYVLTPDFALKLFVLNERRKAGISTLFKGDTGLGK